MLSRVDQTDDWVDVGVSKQHVKTAVLGPMLAAQHSLLILFQMFSKIQDADAFCVVYLRLSKYRICIFSGDVPHF